MDDSAVTEIGWLAERSGQGGRECMQSKEGYD